MTEVKRNPTSRLLSSGEFARRTQLTRKALRIYDELGLLQPVDVDQTNGYRRYAHEQVRIGRLIGMLRGVEMGLSDIALLLTDLGNDRDAAVRRLDRHLAELEIRHTGVRFLIRHIHANLREEGHAMFQINIRHVPAKRVMSMQRRLRAPETDAFVAEAKATFTDHLQGQAPTGPFALLFHGIVDYESDGPLEAILGCPDGVEPTDVIGIRTEPAHNEAFTTITKLEWEYPAILAAYDAVACSPEVMTSTGSRLSCREVYVAEPDAVEEDELICDIAFPIS